MDKRTNKRGAGPPLGSRNGAKPPEKHFKRTQITVPAEVVEWLRLIGGGNVSKGIRVLYAEHAHLQSPPKD